MNDLSHNHAALSLTGIPIGLPMDSEINSLTDRAAMGLPNHVVESFQQQIQSQIAELLETSSSRLAAIAEDPNHSFHTRYSAGLLLGLTGDPRINLFDPEMIDIPGGEYRVGLEREAVDSVVKEFAEYRVRREWIEKETPAYTVALSAFRIGRYPVTQSEYYEFLRDTSHTSSPSSWPFGVLPPATSNQPVYTIAPEDADSYALWLSKRTGRSFRLPSEAEWEIAASGPHGSEFPWGDRFLPDRANTVEAGILAATPVGIFPLGASPFGCLDMAGNVEEYVSDIYQPYAEGSNIHDDLYLIRGSYRIARGGSFTRYRDLARCRRRHGWFQKPIYVMGFRLAEDVVHKPDFNDKD